MSLVLWCPEHAHAPACVCIPCLLRADVLLRSGNGDAANDTRADERQVMWWGELATEVGDGG